MPTLSYKYRIEPNRMQAGAPAGMLADFCQLYNAALEQRIEAYRRRSISLQYGNQALELKAVRCAAPALARWSFSSEQQVLRRLDKTFKAFFARGRGFPRFRASARYHAAEFRVGDGLTIRKNGRLGFVGVPGDIKVRWHRELPSKPSSAILTRQAGKWYIVFHVEVDVVERAGPDKRRNRFRTHQPDCLEQRRDREAAKLDEARRQKASAQAARCRPVQTRLQHQEEAQGGRGAVPCPRR